MAGPRNEICLQTADFLQQQLRWSQKQHIVDLGCGDAALATELADRELNVKDP